MTKYQPDGQSSGVFQLRGATYTMMTLRVVDPYGPGFLEELVTKIEQAPGFFRDAPIALDLDSVADYRGLASLTKLVQELRQLGLVPIGFHGGGDALQEDALACGLARLPAGRGASYGSGGTGRPAPAHRATMLLTEPIRSGRQIYAQGDLIVVGNVSAGAEVLADGNIHVYGVLHGRALAGVTGDTEARIFCQKLDAQLVSIAGFYQVKEEISADLLNRNAQIALRGNYLIISPIS